MRSGERAFWRAWLRRVALALGLAACAPAWPVDNPDLPDFVADFAARDATARAPVDAAPGPAEAQTAALAYAAFLDAELAKALAALQARLGAEQRAALDAAQRRWLAWRTAELGFVAAEWSIARHGSSSRLSRRAHAATVTRDRVRQLLQYLKEQPPR